MFVTVQLRKKDPGKKVIYWDSEAYVNTFIRNLKSQESKRLYEFKRRNRSADILIFDDFSFLLSGNKTASLQCFFQMINELYMDQKQQYYPDAPDGYVYCNGESAGGIL